MILQEPKVEFVSLRISEAIYTSDPAGGGQYCIASMEEAVYCPNWSGNVDWSTPQPTPAPGECSDYVTEDI